MKRPLFIWIAFVLCLLIAVTAMGWVSWAALCLESERIETEDRAQVEERVRLALWRMDSALLSIIALENGRSFSAYQPYTLVAATQTKAGPKATESNVLVPSPLSAGKPRHANIYFQYAPDGNLSSPNRLLPIEEPSAEEARAILGYNDQVQSTLDSLSGLAAQKDLGSRLPVLAAPGEPQRKEQSLPDRRGESTPQLMASQGEGFSNEPQARYSVNQEIQQTQQGFTQPSSVAFNVIRQAAMQPLWVNGELLLARRVWYEGEEYLQGVWLDWPGVKRRLLSSVADLLPDADLEPILSERRDTDPTRSLVALPAVLRPGHVPPPARAGISPLVVSLMVAWACVLAAALAGAVVLHRTISLSERRGAFVSAVTHELRTPLTTFRMYTELLSERMIAPEKRRAYLDTLRREADRLGHLVENVLGFARLERTRTRKARERVTPGEFLDRCLDQLTERAAQAEMDVVVEDGPAWDRYTVCVDPPAVDRILFNLVDNAAKYACDAPDKRIHLEADCDGDRVLLSVRDHGPGIARADARHLFLPFRKSAKAAAESAPGVGLGLAISRRLARSMKGDLRLMPGRGQGACFVLMLPLG